LPFTLRSLLSCSSCSNCHLHSKSHHGPQALHWWSAGHSSRGTGHHGPRHAIGTILATTGPGRRTSRPWGPPCTGTHAQKKRKHNREMGHRKLLKRNRPLDRILDQGNALENSKQPPWGPQLNSNRKCCVRPLSIEPVWSGASNTG
jgi:hypothetical protein